MEERKHDIVKDAYYLISKFLDAGKDITNLQVQKLMYFFESYYMNVYNVDKVYDCNFCAWAFGPVAIPLYKKFKKFGNDCIGLTEEEKVEQANLRKEYLKLFREGFKQQLDSIEIVKEYKEDDEDSK